MFKIVELVCLISCTNHTFSRIAIPKYNPAFVRFVGVNNHANSLSKTQLRSRIGSLVSEEIVFKIVELIGQKSRFKSEIFYQGMPFEELGGFIGCKTQYNGSADDNKSRRDPVYGVLRPNVAGIASEAHKTICFGSENPRGWNSLRYW